MGPWLSEAGLAALPESVIRPAYDRSALELGIVHLGVGNFHRAHQAAYTDLVLAEDPRWGITGVSLRHADMRDALAPQQGLYTLIERGAGLPERARVIGSLRDVQVAAHGPQAIVRRLADPATRIVSLTITEKGYCRTPGGSLDLDDPVIRADLEPRALPNSALGFVLAACARRQAAGLPGFTVLSCDNLAANGDMTRALLLQFADAKGREPGTAASSTSLTQWIEREVAFPNGMVDRIVPHTTDELRDRVQGLLGVRDRWPVATESFSQWVLEDRFVAGRPPWQLAGVQFVADVAPYEDMKLRLLNAAHSAIAYLGVPAGLATVDAAVAQPVVRAFIECFWRTEAIAALPAGLHGGAAPYCQALMTRFENTALAHRTAQIAMDGSQKLPLRLLPTLRARLRSGGSIDACALVIAAWIRFLAGRTESGQSYEISDPLFARLRAALSGSDGSASGQAGAVLAIPGLFGADLADHASLRAAVVRELTGLLRAGTIGWLTQWPQSGAPVVSGASTRVVPADATRGEPTDSTTGSPAASTSGSGPAGLPVTPPERSSLAVLRGLMPFLRPYRWRVAAAGIALLVASVATLAIPAAFRQLIDVGFATRALQSEVTRGGGHVDAWFLGLFGVATVLALGTAVRFYFVSWLGERVTADLRAAVYSRVLRQDPIFFESLRGGEVLSRLTADTTLIQTLVGTSVSMGLRNVLLFIGGLVMLLATSAKLASLIVGLLVVVIVPILLFGRRVRKLSRASQDRIADSSALAGETLSAIQIVQAYAREAFEAARFSASTEEAFQAAVRRTRARSILTALAIVLVFGAIVFVLWLGAQAVLQGRMSAGELTQFILYAAIVAGSVGALSEVMGDVQRAAGAAERLLELLAAQPRIVGPGAASSAAIVESGAAIVGSGAAIVSASNGATVSPGARVGHAGAAVSFDSVNFHYPSRPAEAALVDLNLSVEPGETIALVGPSGAGKTTVFSLLLRFYDPQSGIVRLDGVDLRQFEPTALRERIGLVSQDSVVFSADVMENIRYGRLEASDDEVRAAAAAAHADEFIDRLPQGYRTYVGERGVRLSGGQRQRIAIARALLKNPPLLLLDEATSALDAQSEQAVQAALEQAMRGRTTLVIAHRLATITGADRIVVFERGHLIDTGTHAELVARGGLYARLAAMQFTQ